MRVERANEAALIAGTWGRLSLRLRPATSSGVVGRLDTFKNLLRCAAVLGQVFDFALSGNAAGEVYRGVRLIISESSPKIVKSSSSDSDGIQYEIPNIHCVPIGFKTPVEVGSPLV